MFSLLWQVNIWCFPSSLFTLYLHFLRSSLVIYFPFSPSFLFPLSCLLFLSPFCPSCSKVLLSKDRTRCRWWRQIIEDIIKRLTRRSVRFTHHIWNIKKKKNCMQTGLTVRQALIFIHRQTHRHSAVGVWPYTVELNTSLASFGCLSTHTHARTAFQCVLSTNEGLFRHVHLVPSQIWMQSAHPLALKASVRSCVCVVCFWVCVCVIRNVAWSPLVCAFGSVCQRAAAEAENWQKSWVFPPLAGVRLHFISLTLKTLS